MAIRAVCLSVLVALSLFISFACADKIATKDPSMDGYWDTTAPMFDTMTWDEWCTALGAFLTQGSALDRHPDSLRHRWQESARTGGMRRVEYTESMAYCGEPWRDGAAEPSFTASPTLYFPVNEFGALMLPAGLIREPALSQEDQFLRWGVGHASYAEAHFQAGFTDDEIATAWMRATRLMGFTREHWKEALRHYGKAMRLYSNPESS